jgi:hypothetical protein
MTPTLEALAAKGSTRNFFATFASFCSKSNREVVSDLFLTEKHVDRGGRGQEVQAADWSDACTFRSPLVGVRVSIGQATVILRTAVALLTLKTTV